MGTPLYYTVFLRVSINMHKNSYILYMYLRYMHFAKGEYSI
nr:MAG TPA: hypothetical protein [Caudoviricetes sp.]